MVTWDKDKQRKQTDRKPVDPVDYASDSIDPVASVDPAPVPPGLFIYYLSPAPGLGLSPGFGFRDRYY